MQKKIVKIVAVHMGSVHIDFEDGTMTVLGREQVKNGVPKLGDLWPPEEVKAAVVAPEPEPEPAPAPVPETGGTLILDNPLPTE